jgi:ATP-dependent Clp protease ATP-binding subunit ClpB
MTSNLAGEEIRKLTEEQGADWEIEAHVTDVLKQYFRPEFLNRIDETIVFKMLGREDLTRIVDIQLGYLAERMKGRNLLVVVTDAAKNLLLDEGYDPAFGARPLKRAIQQRVENPLAKEILAGKFADGDTVKVDSNQRTFTFSKV